jgi:N,N'-diacetyllegionaminate synthase
MSVLVIAEIGVNHGGSEAEAYKLIDAAVEAGADVAKFQYFQPVGGREQYKHLCLPEKAYKRINKYCKSKGIKFACTAFDQETLKWLLKNTQMAFVKISSGERLNEDLLQVADKAGIPVVQSIPHGDFKYNDRKKLHVVPLYPTPASYANLMRVNEMHCSGLSDHSGDIFMPLAAVAMGAKYIECHITLDKEQDGPDHKASLDPAQFKEMVRGIRIIEKGLQ